MGAIFNPKPKRDPNAERMQQQLEQEKTINPVNEPSLENISMENAAYLQNVEDVFSETQTSKDDDIPAFEVDSIELATPELFSENQEENSYNQDTINESEPKVFESSKSEEITATKEPEMFEETNLEENFEIPAFLRRQKN